MLAFNQITHCANENCLAIYLTPPKYEPFAAFCPCCRDAIIDQIESEQRLLDELEDGTSN